MDILKTKAHGLNSRISPAVTHKENGSASPYCFLLSGIKWEISGIKQEPCGFEPTYFCITPDGSVSFLNCYQMWSKNYPTGAILITSAFWWCCSCTNLSQIHKDAPYLLFSEALIVSKVQIFCVTYRIFSLQGWMSSSYIRVKCSVFFSTSESQGATAKTYLTNGKRSLSARKIKAFVLWLSSRWW